ncbi:hypothetical protein E4U27_006613 [Claviceps purpurea]|nr:hypothetical protein E4U27_006613 [Claviceps purpurea]
MSGDEETEGGKGGDYLGLPSVGLSGLGLSTLGLSTLGLSTLGLSNLEYVEDVGLPGPRWRGIALPVRCNATCIMPPADSGQTT